MNAVTLSARLKLLRIYFQYRTRCYSASDGNSPDTLVVLIIVIDPVGSARHRSRLSAQDNNERRLPAASAHRSAPPWRSLFWMTSTSALPVERASRIQARDENFPVWVLIRMRSP